MKYTFATLLSSPSYTIGVITLYKSILMYGKTQYPFLCIYTCNLTDNEINLLKRNGINCLKLDKSLIDGVKLPNNCNIYSHWNYTFDKLQLWNLDIYDKIVFLDSDMIVLENIDDLFSKPNFSAVAAGSMLHKNWNRLNSGLMVIEPNKKTYRELLFQMTQTLANYTFNNISVGDQDVINDYLPQWHTSIELHLPEDYNVFFKYLTVYHKKFGFNYNKNIKVIHFVGSKKPWNDNHLKYYIKLLFFSIKNPYGVKSYRIYHQLLNDK